MLSGEKPAPLHIVRDLIGLSDIKICLYGEKKVSYSCRPENNYCNTHSKDIQYVYTKEG